MGQKTQISDRRYDDEFNQFTLDLNDKSGTTTVSVRKPKKKPYADRFWYFLGYAGDLGFTIAVPIAGGVMLGYWLDGKLSSYPKATLLLLLIGVFIGVSGSVKTIRALLEKKK